MRLRHKFNAVRTETGGRTYDSKAEARYAEKLALLKASGDVLFWLEQVPFILLGCKYRVDFQVFWAGGSVEFVEVKGMETAIWKLKMKQMTELYPMVEVTVVK